LLVDDDQINNFLNARLLKKLDIADEVAFVPNGVEGIKCLEDNCFKSVVSPQLILLDINMPVMDGFEFMETYNHLNFTDKGKTIIAVLSSSSSNQDHEKIKNLGVKYYIHKPLTESKVMNFIHQINDND
jgi:CheY-like chemotaxis protein